MFKNTSYNQLKKIRFIAGIIVILAYIPYFILADYVPESLEIAVGIFTILVLFLHLFSLIIFSYKTSSYAKKEIEDEASEENDRNAAQFTYTVVLYAIVALLAVTIFIEIPITISSPLCFFVFIILQVINDGHYLYLERRDMRYAGTDDED